MNNQSASAAIAKLSTLTEGLNFRRNPYFYLLFGVATLWDIHYLFRLECWRKQHGPNLAHWFDILGELESLNSLAGFAYAHPAYATPDIVDDDFVLDFTSAAHPLLPADRSIANSLTLSGSGANGADNGLQHVGEKYIFAYCWG